VLGSAGGYALYQVLTRRVVGIDSPETSVAYSALVGTLVLSIPVPFAWRTPEDAMTWLLLGTLGLLGLWGPASIIAPFHYVQLVWAAVLGYLIFGDVPSAWTWLGAAVIVLSGLFLAWREGLGRPV
jgi:drug/metabolite transporter (DMT)-like permease